MSSIQQHREHFARTPQVNIQRSTFDRSSGHKTTFDPGYIVPLLVEEILPGDTIDLKTNAFVRMLTPIVPYMDNLYLDLFAFFVPNRLVWDNWEKFNGQQDNPGDSIDYTIPQIPYINLQQGTLGDYFGLPPTPPSPQNFNALPFRGYNLIYNEWFRDQDLINAVVVDKDNGPDTATDYILRRRAKRHDYFTSCRPWPQKGPDVLIPMSSSAPVVTNNQVVKMSSATDSSFTNLAFTARNAAGVLYVNGGASDSANRSLIFGNESGLQADTSDLSGTINQLREAEAVQVLLERDARSGTRYIEFLKSQFGVINPDFRLQRPELLGQGQLRVTTNPVPQTSSTDSTTPQGNLAAFSVASGKEKFNFIHSFTEHGYLHVYCSVRADLNYQQGLHKMWSRQQRYDFYIPALANLGEQAVLNKEIYFKGTIDPTYDEGVFGYQERWAEYRYGYNRISGAFRSTFVENIDEWHLAQHFIDDVVLDSAFILENPPIDRILAVEPQNDAFFGDFWFDIKHTRPMPVYSIPGWSSRL